MVWTHGRSLSEPNRLGRGGYFALRTNVSGADGDVVEPELRHPNGYRTAGAQEILPASAVNSL